MLFIEALRRALQQRCRAEQGVATVEYAMMLILIAIAVAAFGQGISGEVTGVFSRMLSVLN